VFLADDPFEVRLKLEAHSGALIVASAAANRSTVKKGDTLLELDPVYINRDVAAAENELTAAKAALAKAESDSVLGEQADALAMRIQQQETKNAEAAVKWWEQVDGPQMLTSAELQVKVSRANVEDQEDELDQLKKMYKGEDLTSQTADIVLKRSVRQLDVSKTLSKMNEERSEKTESHSYPIARQGIQDSLELSKQRLESLKVSQALAAVLRKDRADDGEAGAGFVGKEAERPQEGPGAVLGESPVGRGRALRLLQRRRVDRRRPQDDASGRAPLVGLGGHDAVQARRPEGGADRGRVAVGVGEGRRQGAGDAAGVSRAELRRHVRRPGPQARRGELVVRHVDQRR
jgi:hypothetical protein